MSVENDLKRLGQFWIFRSLLCFEIVLDFWSFLNSLPLKLISDFFEFLGFRPDAHQTNENVIYKGRRRKNLTTENTNTLHIYINEIYFKNFCHWCTNYGSSINRGSIQHRPHPCRWPMLQKKFVADNFWMLVINIFIIRLLPNWYQSKLAKSIAY